MESFSVSPLQRAQSQQPTQMASSAPPEEPPQSLATPEPVRDPNASLADSTIPTATHSSPVLSPLNKSPHFIFANIGGLLSETGRVAKIPILSKDCIDSNPIFLAFTESHLNDSSKESEYHIPNYTPITCNRRSRAKGGVIVYLHNHLTYSLLSSSSDHMCSLLAIHIKEINLVLILAYRPPPDYDSQHHGEPLMESFSSVIISNALQILRELPLPLPDIIMAGDFNFPKATWRDGSGIPSQGHSPENIMLNQLLDLCDHYSLSQKINFGTRSTHSGGSNMLDLLFTNNDHLINRITKHKTALSDHDIITCYTSHDLEFSYSNRESSDNLSSLSSYNLNKANWGNIKEALGSLNWAELFENKNAEQQQEVFMNSVSEVICLNCPKYAARSGKNKSRIPHDRKVLFRQRKRKISLKNKPNISNRLRLKLDREIHDIESKLIASYKKERLRDEQQAVNNIKSNPKYFYSYARKHQAIKASIGPLKINENFLRAPEDICKALLEQYSSVFSTPNPSSEITNPADYFNMAHSHHSALCDIEFNEVTIENEISLLKNNSAAGPDHFPILLLKTCKRELSKPLYLMWRYSLDHGEIASIFKHAIVCPVLKANSESYLAKSYRPISLTSHLIKVFEKIVSSAIVDHLTANNLLPPNQHGFLKGRSTLSQLLNHVETIIRVLESGRSVDTIYLDFAKAFDKVDHSILCRKIKSLGIGGNVGVWLHAFLTNRTQQVSANGSISPYAPVLSGVPQGTVLGPILFTIMISDLDSDLKNAFALLFADDSRVSRIITSEDDVGDFQMELSNTIYPWAPINKAVFNGDKFEHMRFSKLNVPPHAYYDPLNNPITEKSVIKDLGIWLSNDLCWNNHIDKIICACKRQMAWILRTFSKRDITTMRTLWISLLRPIIDYCSPLWSPNPLNYGNIDRLESVLRSFTKHVEGLENKSYKERLQALNLQSIQRRHERYKIIYIFKMKEGLVPNLPINPENPESSFALTFTYTNRNGCRCNLPNPILHHNPAIIQRNSSFALTACNLWNCLPPCISNMSQCSVDKFKRQLDKFLSLFPDEPRCCSSGLYTDPNTGRLSNSIWHLRYHDSVKVNLKHFERLAYTSTFAGEGLTEVIPHP